MQAHVLPLIELPNLQIAHKALYRRVFEIYVAHPHLSYVDAYQAAPTEQESPPELYSFDTDFDAIPMIARIEPSQQP